MKQFLPAFHGVKNVGGIFVHQIIHYFQQIPFHIEPYNCIFVIVDEVYTAEAEGRTRPMTKQEIMRIRLAALSAIVRNMQKTVEADYKSVDHELATACRTQSV